MACNSAESDDRRKVFVACQKSPNQRVLPLENHLLLVTNRRISTDTMEWNVIMKKKKSR